MGGQRSESTLTGFMPESKQGVMFGAGSMAPSPSRTLESLEEITSWLGTFRERLRQARDEERTGTAAILEQLEARYQLRRAELA